MHYACYVRMQSSDAPMYNSSTTSHNVPMPSPPILCCRSLSAHGATRSNPNSSPNPLDLALVLTLALTLTLTNLDPNPKMKD